MRNFAYKMLEQEAFAMYGRLERVRPFVITETMVSAASISITAQRQVDSYLSKGRLRLKQLITAYVAWLRASYHQDTSISVAQRRFTHLRLKFNAVLSQFDIYSDVYTQRSEYETGVWLAGLDALAEDALLIKDIVHRPSMICYLERGPGAAIRRAETRLPGGGRNPAAIIRVPRERMIGSGIASSVVHEVGHQGAALLKLVDALKSGLEGIHSINNKHQTAWELWSLWISEIVADLWAICRLGVIATMGLIGVLSLPRPFVFKVSMDDPHPFPWIRVILSCRIGAQLYPDDQWQRIEQLWIALYPPSNLNAQTWQIINLLLDTADAFADMLINKRFKSLKGKRLTDCLGAANRNPDYLRGLWQQHEDKTTEIKNIKPTLAFAVLGQAKVDGKLLAGNEDKIISTLLQDWAVRRSMTCAC